MDEMEPEKNFSIGYTDESLDVMVIFVPIRAYSDNPDGTALLRGKLDEAKAIALMKIQERRQKKAALGIVKPNGPMPLGVA